MATILLGKFEGGGSLVTDILIIAFIFQKEVEGMASQKYFQDKPISHHSVSTMSATKRTNNMYWK